MQTLSDSLLHEIRIAEAFAQPCSLEQYGKLACFIEPLGISLNQCFILRVQGENWIGRKILRKNIDQQWKNSSLIEPTLLLGQLDQMHIGDDGVSFYYRISSPSEKKTVFKQALTCVDADLFFPFPILDVSWKEQICPPTYWNGHSALAEQLDADELHFREYTAAWLGARLASNALIYDPACSTGTFIAHLFEALPNHQYIGSDLSPSMIEYAVAHYRSEGLQFYIGDARQPILGNDCCDVLILRFLNAEMMTRNEAHTIFQSLIKVLKPGGIALAFGHTPVLLSAPYLAQNMGLTLESCLAARPGKIELFQFYVFNKQ